MNAALMAAESLPVPLHIEYTRQKNATRYDVCGPQGRIVAHMWGEQEAETVVRCVNAHDALVAALQQAANALQRSELSPEYRSDRTEALKAARAALAAAKVEA